MLAMRHSVEPIRETRSHADCQGMVVHSHLSTFESLWTDSKPEEWDLLAWPDLHLKEKVHWEWFIRSFPKILVCGEIATRINRCFSLFLFLFLKNYSFLLIQGGFLAFMILLQVFILLWLINILTLVQIFFCIKDHWSKIWSPLSFKGCWLKRNNNKKRKKCKFKKKETQTNCIISEQDLLYFQGQCL